MAPEQFEIVIKKDLIEKYMPEGLEEEFKKGGICAITDDLQYDKIEGIYGSFQLQINGKRTLKEDVSYPLYMALMGLNNGFYELISTKEKRETKFYTTYPPLHEDFLRASKQGDSITFLPNKYLDKKDCISIPFSDAIEEVIRAVNEYKDLLWHIFHQASPAFGDYLMIEMFGKEERYTKKFYEDENFDWKKCVEVLWSKIEKPLVIRKVNSREEHEKQYKEDQKDDKHVYYYVANYYSAEMFGFLPLETAWKEHKEIIK